MQLWMSMLMSLALVSTKVPVDNWSLATTCVQADVQGMSSHRAMPTQDSCIATWDHGDGQPRLLPEARYVSGSAALRHLGSELTAMVPVATKGCAEACSLGWYLGSCWFYKVKFLLEPYGPW